MTPRQTVADDFTRAISQVQNPHSMDAWSERIEQQTWERLRDRVDKEMARMEDILRRAGVDPKEFCP